MRPGTEPRSITGGSTAPPPASRAMSLQDAPGDGPMCGDAPNAPHPRMLHQGSHNLASESFCSPRDGTAGGGATGVHWGSSRSLENTNEAAHIGHTMSAKHYARAGASGEQLGQARLGAPSRRVEPKARGPVRIGDDSAVQQRTSAVCDAAAVEVADAAKAAGSLRPVMDTALPVTTSATDSAAEFVALVVDDVKPTRRLVARVLKRRCGVTKVLQAANGREAVEACRGAMGTRIELITMDVQMPVMDGLEATRAIRAMGFQGLIVGLTGNALQEDVAQLKEAGADEVCTKPVDPKLLQYVVGLHIDL